VQAVKGFFGKPQNDKWRIGMTIPPSTMLTPPLHQRGRGNAKLQGRALLVRGVTQKIRRKCKTIFKTTHTRGFGDFHKEKI